MFANAFTVYCWMKNGVSANTFSPIFVLELTDKFCKLSQPEKQEGPIVSTLFGITRLDRLEQPAKQKSSIDVTLFGIAILVRLVHHKKQLCVSHLILSGMVSSVRLEQPQKQPRPIDRT
jgi:hypothetical protein